MNHLRPDIRHGRWSADEEEAFVAAHRKEGNRWSTIAKALPVARPAPGPSIAPRPAAARGDLQWRR